MTESGFGQAVSLSENFAVIGARYDSTLAYKAGAAYVFELVCPAADLTGDCSVNARDFAIMAQQWLDGID